MIRLFQYEGYTVRISPEALMLAPFKKIWDRDKSNDKHKAMQELGYVYFMEDPRSDYQFIIDRDDRIEEIKKGEGLPEKWKPDEIVQKACAFYASFKPASAGLLEDTKVAIDKLRSMIRDIDLEAKDGKGRPIYTLSVITQTIKQIPALVKDLEEAERSLSRDIISDSKARGSQVKGLYEDII